MFEVSSAFGTVGLSMGFNGLATSFSGALHPASRFIIILVMLAGCHRGKPFSFDPAVNLSVEIEREIAEIQKFSQNKLNARALEEQTKKVQLTNQLNGNPPGNSRHE